MFTTSFGSYICDGDYITCEVEGFDVTATIYYDDDTTAPDKRQDGFWPSNDPNDAGYVLPENFAAQQALAEHVMNAWNNDEWHYYGVAVTVDREAVTLTGKYAHAVWGIEGNYPEGDNSYFLEVANELLDEALAAAKEKIKKLTATV